MVGPCGIGIGGIGRAALGLSSLVVLGFGCEGASSVTDLPDGPYRISVRLVDPATGEALPVSGGAATWPLGVTERPALEVTYSAERATPSLSLRVRAVGATLEGALEADPWEDPPAAESEVAVLLTMVDDVERSVRVGIAPPEDPSRAVITAVLGGVEASVAIDFTAENVTIETDGATAPADGATEVAVRLTGAARQTVAVETSRGIFVAPYDSEVAEVTLDPTGEAVLGLISDTPGPAVLWLSGAPGTWVRVDFAPVRVVMGAPVAADRMPGRVVHDVCVATNTAKGTVGLSAAAGWDAVLAPDEMTVWPMPETPPPGCPAGAFAGYAIFGWAASGETDVLTATWSSPNGYTEISTSARATASAFAGYDADFSADILGSGDVVRVVVTAALTYRAGSGLAEAPAGGVSLTFDAYSDYGAEELSADAATGPDGTATAVFEAEVGDVLDLFVTPEGSASMYLGSIDVF